MKKAISIGIVIAVCLILALSSTVSAAKADKSGPVDKATGWVSPDGEFDDWYVEFDAHEGIGDRPAKGTMRHWTYNTDGTIDRELQFEVKYVDVEGDMAWFAANCTSDTDNIKVGHWVYVVVKDGGEPGIGVDEIGWRWPPKEVPVDKHEEWAKEQVEDRNPTFHNCGIDEGNLQVHSES